MDITFFRFVTIHSFDRRTDRRTAFSWLDRVVCNARSGLEWREQRLH